MRTSLVPGHDPGTLTGAGSNSWLIHGRVPTLIDTGSGRPEHARDLASTLEQTGETLAQVLVTHAHPDHAGGARAVAEQWPTARFAKLPAPDVDPRYDVAWHPLADDQLVDAGDEQLWVVHTPGHAPDHVCFFEPRTSTLFAGDLVMNGGTIVIPPSMGGSLTQYLASLRRILELQPRRILAGHGAVIEQPASLIRAYISHRLGRERQILDALARGPLPIAGIVPVVYPELRPELVRAAGESVLAHLRKLEDEGRARLDGADPVLSPWSLAT